MANKTGFIVFSTKKDLSELFKLRTSVARPKTGYIKFSTGEDLSQIFEPYVSGTKALTTGYKLADGVTDLCDVFAPKLQTFTLSTLENYSTGVPFSGFIWGATSANNGIGYVSAYQQTTGTPPLLFKTTNYGVNFSKIVSPTIPNGGIRGVATNQDNNMLVISYAGTAKSQYSTNGGASFNPFGSSDLHQSCIMTRQNSNNFVIQNVNNATGYSWASSNYTANNNYNALQNSSITNSISGTNSISDRPNLFVTTSSGLNVYRNADEAVITTSSTGTNTPVTINNVDGTAKYVGTCCNAMNNKNFIVNRTTGTTGGSIYMSGDWDLPFGNVANSPIELWNQIATSSSGMVVCAIADKLIYLSLDYGVTWANVSYTPALQTTELFRFVTVSPDDKFIVIGTNGTTAISRIFYCVLQ